MKKITTRNIFEAVLYILVVCAFIFGIPSALSYILKAPYPMATITSESMWPVLKKNDMVFITTVTKEDLKIGDIVVFKNERGFTIHRIIGIQGEMLTTKGDANNISDEPISYEEIIGRTVNYGHAPLKIPEIGSISIWAANFRSKAVSTFEK